MVQWIELDFRFNECWKDFYLLQISLFDFCCRIERGSDDIAKDVYYVAVGFPF